METLRFPYRSQVWKLLLGGLFFAGCGVFAWKDAISNDRGLVINGIIHLGLGAATGFYWLLTAACVAFVLAAALGLIRALGPAQEVVIGPTVLEAPRTGLSREMVTVPYASITSLQEQQVRSQRFLIIRLTHGKLTIVGGMLPAKTDFDTIAAEIDRRRRSAVRGS